MQKEENITFEISHSNQKTAASRLLYPENCFILQVSDVFI